jgi:hypothetical protein
MTNTSGPFLLLQTYFILNFGQVLLHEVSKRLTLYLKLNSRTPDRGQAQIQCA